MEKTLHFTNGQISADIDVKLDSGRLSISGVVYEGATLLKSERNLISAGQCLDDARPILPAKLAEVWERWHLNDLRAGTHRQEEALRPVKDTFNRLNWYDEACEYLSSLGLLFDGDYKYGSAWLTEELPVEVIEYIESL